MPSAFGNPTGRRPRSRNPATPEPAAARSRSVDRFQRTSGHEVQHRSPRHRRRAFGGNGVAGAADRHDDPFDDHASRLRKSGRHDTGHRRDGHVRRRREYGNGGRWGDPDKPVHFHDRRPGGTSDRGATGGRHLPPDRPNHGHRHNACHLRAPRAGCAGAAGGCCDDGRRCGMRPRRRCCPGRVGHRPIGRLSPVTAAAQSADHRQQPAPSSRLSAK